MSWSVSAIGKTEAVKKALAEQFAQAQMNTRHIQSECESVVLAEKLVNNQLDFALENGVGCVKVDASGSASKESKSELRSYPGSCQIAIAVQSLYNFVE